MPIRSTDKVCPWSWPLRIHWWRSSGSTCTHHSAGTNLLVFNKIILQGSQLLKIDITDPLWCSFAFHFQRRRNPIRTRRARYPNDSDWNRWPDSIVSDKRRMNWAENSVRPDLWADRPVGSTAVPCKRPQSPTECPDCQGCTEIELRWRSRGSDPALSGRRCPETDTKICRQLRPRILLPMKTIQFNDF